MPNEMLLPPGYTSQASMKKIAQAKRNMMGGGQTLERLIEVGMFLCGSPQTVIEKIEAAHASTGVEHVALMAQFGTLPAELTRKNLEMLAGEVFPRLRRADVPARTAARIA
jgi:alkanesulfonate monooxygenase SsuD/methylene tetrahydromethanopterin reductase-like flavin-dependent oxidoreductase (luciferase family)